MKTHGDVPQEYKEMEAELLAQEVYFEEALNKGLPADIIAKAYVCMAHDWYSMGIEEKGDVLLEKAELAYPGYFKEVIGHHIMQDEVYALIVRNISNELRAIVLSQLKSVR